MIRLNLGCGDDRLEGWTNVDLREEVADVVCDVAKLEHWGDGLIDEILALDVLEHFPGFRTQDVLAEWRRVLKPGGLLTLRVPNLHQLCRWVAEGYKVNEAIRNIYGAHRWGPDGGWDAHHTGWTPTLLEGELAQAGFEVVANDMSLNMTVEARSILPGSSISGVRSEP